MDLSRIRPYAHKHCRFKLRNGREVFGVIWEVETAETLSGSQDQHLFFASVRDYEQLQHDPSKPVSVIDMPAEEILHVESLAS
ncbi:MAG: hypothetical protein KDC00_05880 [Flavobacteriales bacterium]|nr:hypothetical protein [Flavobacteriales bacterium]